MREHKIADLEWLLMPAMAAGQFSLAEAQSRETGVVAPVGVVLWARVSAEVDQRLSDNLDQPIRLAPNEWQSGDIFWLIETIGDRQAVAAQLKLLSETEFKGRPVKTRGVGADGKMVIGTVGAGQ